MNLHLTYNDRQKIEQWLDEGVTISEIAKKLQKSISTIYRELKRGEVRTSNDCYYSESGKIIIIKQYSAKIAHSIYKKHKQNCGLKQTYTNSRLIHGKQRAAERQRA